VRWHASFVVALVVALAGCGAATESRQGGHQAPRDGRAGLQLSGTFSGRQVALSDGAPTLLVGSTCQQQIGLAARLCFGSRDIDGSAVVVSFLNPDVVRQGASLPVASGGCRTAEACADVTDVAVVEVQVDGQRQRASSGQLDVQQVVPGSRYVGTVTLGFREGSLGGTFDVVPRPAEG
jgi:hypothetical protein